MRILIVGAHLAKRSDIQTALRNAEAVIDVVTDLGSALDYASAYEYAAVLCSAHLSIVRSLRLAHARVPLIAFSGIENEIARAEAYRVGADDVVSCVCHEDLLWARITAVVRRANGQATALVQWGDLAVDIQSRQVTVQGRSVHLTRKEYQILETMLLRRGHVLRKEQFLHALYGGLDGPEIKIIDVMVCKLRKKLLDAGIGNLIRTVWGQGYMVPSPASSTVKVA
jgi:two-component system cell cycle response regulator CtrA